MIHELHKDDRESFAVAKNLDVRLRSFRRNGDCGRCWLQKAHCICDEIPSLEHPEVKIDIDQDPVTSSLLGGLVRRMFVLTHHKEICLVVDTAKLIVASLPDTCRLVVAGISPNFQDSMDEMLQCIRNDPSSCIVLFPSEDAKTYAEITNNNNSDIGENQVVPSQGWDVIVIDGTWEQARKMYQRYLKAGRKDGGKGLLHVKLSDASLAAILTTATKGSINNNDNSSSQYTGMQLRRHPEEWRQISTLTATRLLLTEMVPEKVTEWNKMMDYQIIGDQAARKQLGPIRLRQVK
eukprot:scaffold2655_cov179-Amphora_coffeaeformis.AAC.29